jgi:hypothetical protein
MKCTNELCRGDVKLLKARVSGKWYLRCSKCDTISYVTRYNVYSLGLSDQERLELLRQIDAALAARIAILREHVKIAKRNRIREAECRSLCAALENAEMELRLCRMDIQHIERNMRRVK